MRLTYWRWFGPLPAAFILQAVHGILYANGVFVSLINNSTFTKAIGFIALFVALGITVFGILLHHASDPKVHHSTPRLLTILGAIAMSAQFLMSYGLKSNLTILIYLGAIINGIGSGIVAVVSIAVMQAWAPDYPSFVTGLGLVFGGAGTLLGICYFQPISEWIGDPVLAFGFVGLLQTIIAGLSAIFIEHPPTGWSPLSDFEDNPNWSRTNTKLVDIEDNDSMYESSRSYCETEPLLADKSYQVSFDDTSLSTSEILVDPAFYLAFICLFAAVGPGFGLVLSFPKMINLLFGVNQLMANQSLFWVTLFGVIGRLAIGLVIDLLSGTDEKYGFEGTKVVNQALLVLQSIALAIIPICTRYGWIQMFTIATALIFVTFNGSSVLAASMSRAVFSPKNSTLAFALLGIAMGIGRVLFSMVVAFCMSENISENFDRRRIFEFDPFIHFAFLISALGLIASYYVLPSKAAYKSRANSPVFTDLAV